MFNHQPQTVILIIAPHYLSKNRSIRMISFLRFELSVSVNINSNKNDENAIIINWSNKIFCK